MFRGGGDRRGNEKPKKEEWRLAGKWKEEEQMDKNDKVGMIANSRVAPEERLPSRMWCGLGGGADGN